MNLQAGLFVSLCRLRPIHRSFATSLFAGLLLSVLPLNGQLQAYDGPSFTKGLWLFQRSTEFVTQHWVLPNARRVKVEQPVARCVNPTEAMIETFRAVNIGSCQSTSPTRQKNTFVFAKRCDYLGPVKTVITVESETAYRETNELLAGKSPKRDIVVARRIGDCGTTPDMGTADLGAAARETLAAEATRFESPAAEDPALDISAAKRTDYLPAEAQDQR